MNDRLITFLILPVLEQDGTRQRDNPYSRGAAFIGFRSSRANRTVPEQADSDIGPIARKRAYFTPHLGINRVALFGGVAPLENPSEN
jgi:hypothetical protein